MIKKQFYLLLYSMLALVLSGCVTADNPETPTMRTTMVTTGDLAQLPKTSTGFAWHPTMIKVFTADRVDTDVVVKHMQDAITQVMAAKGYHLVGLNESPGVIVGFGLALESAMSDKEILEKAGLVAGLSTAGIDEKYEKGSVMVALFSPGYKTPLWRVLAQGFTDFKMPGEQRKERFEQLMSMMLKSVPNA